MTSNKMHRLKILQRCSGLGMSILRLLCDILIWISTHYFVCLNWFKPIELASLVHQLKRCSYSYCYCCRRRLSCFLIETSSRTKPRRPTSRTSHSSKATRTRPSTRGTPEMKKMVVVYRCELDGCGKDFMRTWNLLDHVRMHYGQRPYVCQFWAKSFTQKGNMRKHLQQHYLPSLSQRRKYKWSHCESSFTERYNYRVSLTYSISLHRRLLTFK